MKETLKQLFAKAVWFIKNCLGDIGDISFGRTASAFWSLYFMTQDAWFFHRSGHLVDNATLLTQLSVITTFYGTNKVSEIFNKDKS
jgi:hypothetical protein